jgi:hypothetical protein
LEAMLCDNVKARFLQPSGVYKRPRVARGAALRRSQSELLQAAAARPGSDSSPAKSKVNHPWLKLAPSPFGPRQK